MRGWMVVTALGLATLGGESALPQGKKAVWHTDYAAARAEAKRLGKPLFVVFRCQP